jgi:hypothetical protein
MRDEGGNTQVMPKDRLRQGAKKPKPWYSGNVDKFVQFVFSSGEN